MIRILVNNLNLFLKYFAIWFIDIEALAISITENNSHHLGRIELGVLGF